ncbi:MAG: hypothetical protein WBV46_01880 [Terriglobales bacterium]|jgi:hypothetical protein
MIVVLIVAVFLAVSLTLFLALQALRRGAGDGSIQKSADELTPVDLEAFENLTDPEEEHFLRAHLSPAEFRGVQRGRIRAAKLYVAALSQNAAVLLAAGQSAQSNSNAEISAAGRELMHRAFFLRIWCVLSLVRMNAALVLPAQLTVSGKIANQYMLVTYMAANLPRRIAA